MEAGADRAGADVSEELSPDPTGMVWSPNGMSRPIDHLTRDELAGLRWLTSQSPDQVLDDRGRMIALAVMPHFPAMKPSGMATCVAAVKGYCAGLEAARAHVSKLASEAKVN